MTGIPRTRGQPARNNRPPLPPGPPEPRAGQNLGADLGAAAGPLSFRRIVPLPFAAWVAALDHWQLTGPGSELRLGRSVLRGPAGHDRHFGTCRVEVRLARGPLRPRLRMQLHLDHWSPAATAVELIPCGRASPSAAYFRAGRALLDALTSAVAAHPPVPRRASITPPPATRRSSRPQDHVARRAGYRACGDPSPPGSLMKPQPPSSGPPGQTPGPAGFAGRFIQDIAAAATVATGQRWAAPAATKPRPGTITMPQLRPHTIQLYLHCHQNPAGFWVNHTSGKTVRRPWCLSCCQHLDPGRYQLVPFEDHRGAGRSR